MDTNEWGTMLKFLSFLSNEECANGEGEVMKKLDELYYKVFTGDIKSVEGVAEKVFSIYYHQINKEV